MNRIFIEIIDLDLSFNLRLRNRKLYLFVNFYGVDIETVVSIEATEIVSILNDVSSFQRTPRFYKAKDLIMKVIEKL